MALKTFPESCAFAALATLLEREGIRDVRDLDIARDSRVPYLWRMVDGVAMTGSWIVDNDLLNVAAHEWGYSMVGGRFPSSQIPELVRELGRAAMAGIRYAGHGHTVIIERDGDGWIVENMRFARETETGWRWTDTELLEHMQTPEASLSWLDEDGATPLVDIDELHWDTVEKVFPHYRRRLREFWTSPHSQRSLLKQRDEMLRGLVLEGPGLMGTIGEESMQESLARLQFHVFQELGKKAEYTDFSRGYPLDKLDRLLERYAAMLRRGIRSTG